MKKFTLHFTNEDNPNLVITEPIDYSGKNISKLTGSGSWFGSWLEDNGIDWNTLDEENCGKKLLEFFNDTITPRMAAAGNKKRIFEKITLGYDTRTITYEKPAEPVQKPTYFANRSTKCGWISPSGELYPCDYFGHDSLAIELCERNKFVFIYSASYYLEEHKWIKLSFATNHATSKTAALLHVSGYTLTVDQKRRLPKLLKGLGYDSITYNGLEFFDNLEDLIERYER